MLVNPMKTARPIPCPDLRRVPLVDAHCPVPAGIHRAGTRLTWGKHVTPQPPLSGGRSLRGPFSWFLMWPWRGHGNRPSGVPLSSFRRRPESSDRCTTKTFRTPAPDPLRGRLFAGVTGAARQQDNLRTLNVEQQICFNGENQKVTLAPAAYGAVSLGRAVRPTGKGDGCGEAGGPALFWPFLQR